MLDLSAKKCVPCEGGVPPLKEREARELLKHTMLAEQEGHHPDIEARYQRDNSYIYYSRHKGFERK